MIAIATQCFCPDIGGVEALMTALADELARSGARVEAFADHIRTRGLAELVRPYPIHRYSLWQPARRALKRRALAAATRRDPIVGVFANSWKSVAAVPSGVGPIATLAHGTEFPLVATREKPERIAKALARTRTIIASSHYTASLATPYLGDAANRIVVINPPLPTLPAAEPGALAAMRAVIAGRRPVVTTLARLEPRKGLNSVIAALPRLKTRHPDLVYLVAGAGGDLERLRALAAERGVSDSVVFLGPVTDPQVKAALLTSSDVYAMPSRRVRQFGGRFRHRLRGGRLVRPPLPRRRRRRGGGRRERRPNRPRARRRRRRGGFASPKRTARTTRRCANAWERPRRPSCGKISRGAPRCRVISPRWGFEAPPARPARPAWPRSARRWEREPARSGLHDPGGMTPK